MGGPSNRRDDSVDWSWLPNLVDQSRPDFCWFNLDFTIQNTRNHALRIAIHSVRLCLSACFGQLSALSLGPSFDRTWCPDCLDSGHACASQTPTNKKTHSRPSLPAYDPSAWSRKSRNHLIKINLREITSWKRPKNVSRLKADGKWKSRMTLKATNAMQWESE